MNDSAAHGSFYAMLSKTSARAGDAFFGQQARRYGLYSIIQIESESAEDNTIQVDEDSIRIDDVDARRITFSTTDEGKPAIIVYIVIETGEKSLFIQSGVMQKGGQDNRVFNEILSTINLDS